MTTIHDFSYCKISTPIENFSASPFIKYLKQHEPSSMHGQIPVIWDHADGFQVYDIYGNQYIDFSSGVLVANVGHNHPHIKKSIIEQVNKGLLTSYLFPNQPRLQLLQSLFRHVPSSLNQIALFSTGSEAVEFCIKSAKIWGKNIKNSNKNIVISFENSFHGRTLGSQLAGGIPHLKDWITYKDPSFIQLPFPDNFHCKRIDFQLFLDKLDLYEIDPLDICMVLVEPYQGQTVAFAPVEYMQNLRKWCTENNVLLVFDEMQSGFCRTGHWWGYEHYGITPDLIACGKGISSSLPISAAIGKQEFMKFHTPGSAGTTHSTNPVCCVAALASIEVLENENLEQNAKNLEIVLRGYLNNLKKDFPDFISYISGKGLVFGIHIKSERMGGADLILAKDIVLNAARLGLILIAPVGSDKSTIKINPPLCINQEALEEGLEILKIAFTKAIYEYNNKLE